MRPILTTDAMRAAEEAAIDAGTPVETLMERAGAALAEAVYRFAGKMPVLVLAGPGNNGGDGYVAARHLAAKGIAVRIAAVSESGSDAARSARNQWNGDIESLADDTAVAPVFVDALFGTGLKRGLDPDLACPDVTQHGHEAGDVEVVLEDLPVHLEEDRERTELPGDAEEIGRLPSLQPERSPLSWPSAGEEEGAAGRLAPGRPCRGNA